MSPLKKWPQELFATFCGVAVRAIRAVDGLWNASADFENGIPPEMGAIESQVTLRHIERHVENNLRDATLRNGGVTNESFALMVSQAVNSQFFSKKSVFGVIKTLGSGRDKIDVFYMPPKNDGTPFSEMPYLHFAPQSHASTKKTKDVAEKLSEFMTRRMREMLIRQDVSVPSDLYCHRELFRLLDLDIANTYSSLTQKKEKSIVVSAKTEYGVFSIQNTENGNRLVWAPTSATRPLDDMQRSRLQVLGSILIRDKSLYGLKDEKTLWFQKQINIALMTGLYTPSPDAELVVLASESSEPQGPGV